MPPVNTQGSRAALISAVVALAIAFVTALIFAFYYSAQSRAVGEQFATYKTRYNGIVSETALSDPDVEAIKTLRAEPESGYGPTTPVIDIVIDRMKKLGAVVTGANSVASVSDALAADAAGRAAVTDAGKRLADAKSDVKLPAANMVGAANALTAAVLAREGQIAQLQQQLKTTNDSLAARTEEVKAVQAQFAKDVQDVRATAERNAGESQAALAANTGKVEDIEKTIGAERQQYAKTAEELNGQIAALTSRNQQLQKQVETVNQKLAQFRGGVETPTVRQADGRVVRLAGEGVVYIDLGAGDQISPGLTFEVYDKFQGVPAINPTDEAALPVGKASLEVIRVGNTSSECRVTRTQGGQQLTEGDLVANIVYDRNTRYAFMVYGNFDLDRNNVASPAEADVVRRLVTQWGGRLADQVNVDTDFVVLGREPVLPTFAQEELEDPINRKKMDDARAELDAYQKVIDRARDLHIPILNQNRFLYLIGFYNQARR